MFVLLTGLRIYNSYIKLIKLTLEHMSNGYGVAILVMHHVAESRMASRFGGKDVGHNLKST